VGGGGGEEGREWKGWRQRLQKQFGELYLANEEAMDRSRRRKRGTVVVGFLLQRDGADLDVRVIKESSTAARGGGWWRNGSAERIVRALVSEYLLDRARAVFRSKRSRRSSGGPRSTAKINAIGKNPRYSGASARVLPSSRARGRELVTAR